MKKLEEAKLEFDKNYLVGVLKMSGGHVSNAVKYFRKKSYRIL